MCAHFHCEIEFSAWERPGRQDDVDVDVDAACLLISPHGKATLFYYTLYMRLCECVYVIERERASKNKASHSLRQP